MNVWLEYHYNAEKDETIIYIWNAYNLVDKRQMPGNIDWRRKKKITAEIKKEYKDKG